MPSSIHLFHLMMMCLWLLLSFFEHPPLKPLFTRAILTAIGFIFRCTAHYVRELNRFNKSLFVSDFDFYLNETNGLVKGSFTSAETIRSFLIVMLQRNNYVLVCKKLCGKLRALQCGCRASRDRATARNTKNHLIHSARS